MNKILINLVVFLSLMSIIGSFTLYFLPDFPLRDPFINEFNLDKENNFPTLYSSLALLFSSILLAIIGYDRQIKITRYARKWQALSWIFLLLSLDEITSLHENLIEPMRRNFNLSGFLHFGWVLPIGTLVIIFVISFMKFLFHLPLKIRILFIIAGIVFISGALVLEMIGGKYVDLYGEDNFTYSVITTIEEGLEMAGIVIFINALLKYMNLHSITKIDMEFFLEQSKTESKF
ncbi:hypothetical protein [Nodularia sp. NIES-3585]|uniref:hypothetical protein n=1 Tax=Nodularia sp. NIES-3585 TaxID=1973477 RepID=UPI001595F9A1|nr:hypothetical protein [Nodularia sp. NIES-3585]